jgi:AcrR family transcriptional regulator
MAPLKTSRIPSLVSAPKQQRSRELLDRIIDAATGLFERRGYDVTGMADIAAAAGVSVGIIYTRFSTKEHLLVHLAQQFLTAAVPAAERDMQAVADGSLLELAEASFRISARLQRKHQAILAPMSLIVRQTEHPELRRVVASINAAIQGPFRQRVLDRVGEIPHADTEAALDFALASASAALREAILYQPRARLTAAVEAAAARDCARLFVAYLQWDEHDAAPRAQQRRAGK